MLYTVKIAVLRTTFLFLALLVMVGAEGVAVARARDFRSTNQVPPSWVQFSKLVKYRFEQWVSSDDPIAARFRVYLKAQAGAVDGPPDTLDVRVWVNVDGSVARVTFPAFKDAVATTDLRTILSGGNIGERPPPDMLQPINLRLTLTPTPTR